MGQFKLLMPWEGDTVIGRIVRTLAATPVDEIVVVVGHRGAEVAGALADTPARLVSNPGYVSGEMLGSVQVGLRALAPAVQAALVCLGDQPQIETATVRALLDEGQKLGWQKVVVPSYEMRAGHPVLLPRTVWADVLAAETTLKDALTPHRPGVAYVTVNSPSILADLDTPEDYLRERAMRNG
jgi:molybdenum cofactor cytidylyltransferase